MTASALARTSQLRNELATSETFSELATVAKKAISIQQAMSRAGLALELVNQAAEVYIEALYLCGEKKRPDHGGDRKSPGWIKSHQVALDMNSKSRGFAEKLCRWLPSKKRGERVPSAIHDYVVECNDLEVAEKDRKGKQATATGILANYKPPGPTAADEADWIAPTITQADAVQWLDSIPEQSVDLLLTDPPYMTDVDDVASFASGWLPLALSRVSKTGRAYVFVGSYPQELAAYLTVDTGELKMLDVLVWSYTNTLGPKPGRTYIRNWQAVLHLAGGDAPNLRTEVLLEQVAAHEVPHPARMEGRLHQWQKPQSLAEMFVRHSTKPGNSVIDPFAGTGTMLIAAGAVGRLASGCDSDESMIEISKKRGCVDG